MRAALVHSVAREAFGARRHLIIVSVPANGWGEFAENTQRKPFTPTEDVAIARAVEALERAQAKQRQIELGRTHGTPSTSAFPRPAVGRAPADGAASAAPMPG